LRTIVPEARMNNQCIFRALSCWLEPPRVDARSRAGVTLQP
jgi:hypothetical protein